MKIKIPVKSFHFVRILPILIGVLSLGFLAFYYYQTTTLSYKLSTLASQKSMADQQLSTVKSALADLKNQDQYKINKQLESDIKSIETTYDKAVKDYEDLLDLKNISKKTDDFDKLFADSLSLLAKRNYASAEAELDDLNQKIKNERSKIAASFTIPANAPISNTPPSSGFSQQVVHTDAGDFLVDIISADLNSTRVIVDTASDNDCSNDCPVLSLGDYVSRSGAFAAVNGTFFCPQDYPSCADKKNTFDFLVMNKNKHYFNSDKNVYSTNPAVIFYGNTARYVGRAQEWGRDTGVDAVISNFPLLTLNGENAFGGSGEVKINNKGPRSFIGNTGTIVYIGIVFNASVGEAAGVLKILGVANSLNLDDGGSSALWSGGYKAGPGRSLPNAVLFVRK